MLAVRSGQIDADKLDMPPKPKSVREKTYARIEARYDRQDDILNDKLEAAAARYLGF